MNKECSGSTVISLDKLREQGYLITVKESSVQEHEELHITPRNCYIGSALKDDIAHDLEMTIGINETNKIQRKTIQLINHTVLFECIKTATREPEE
jgi:hypothetical protein